MPPARQAPLAPQVWAPPRFPPPPPFRTQSQPTPLGSLPARPSSCQGCDYFVRPKFTGPAETPHSSPVTPKFGLWGSPLRRRRRERRVLNAWCSHPAPSTEQIMEFWHVIFWAFLCALPSIRGKSTPKFSTWTVKLNTHSSDWGVSTVEGATLGSPHLWLAPVFFSGSLGVLGVSVSLCVSLNFVFCLSAALFVLCLSVFLFLCLCLSPSSCLSLPLSMSLFVSLSVSLLSFYVSLYLSVFISLSSLCS